MCLCLHNGSYWTHVGLAISQRADEALSADDAVRFWSKVARPSDLPGRDPTYAGPRAPRHAPALQPRLPLPRLHGGQRCVRYRPAPAPARAPARAPSAATGGGMRRDDTVLAGVAVACFLGILLVLAFEALVR